MTQDSDIPGGERIAKFLSRAGVASRREAERMIEAGRVAVNGAVIDSPALNVTGADRIEVDGAPVGTPEPPRLWLYHKPVGLVTTEKDEKGRRTVFDALPEELPRVMSVGRLDLNSEGLLLLTNDGGIKRRLELPTTGWVRKYRVRVHGTPGDEDFAPLRVGLVVEGEKFQPMSVTLDRQQGANAWVTIGLREGKNREIRRAMEAVGLTVNRLIRVAYGPFRLGELKPGEVEEVKARVLREQLGLGGEEPTGTAKKKPVRRRKPGAFDGPGKPGRPRKPGEKPSAKGPARDRSTDRTTGPAGGGDPRDPGQKLGKTPGGRAGGKPGAKPGAKPGNRPGTGPGRDVGRGPGRGAGGEAGKTPDRRPDNRSGGPGKPGGRGKR